MPVTLVRYQNSGGAAGASSGASARIGELVYHKSGTKTLAEGYLAFTPGTVTNGAVDYPLFAAIYTEFVSGNDIVFPADVNGMFLRNSGGLAAAEGSAQPDATAPNNLGINQLTRRVGIAGGPNQAWFADGGGTGETFTGDDETRPANRAYQLYGIVDTYTG